MAPVQSSPDLSSCYQGMTPPESPTKGRATPPAIVKDLKHLFGVFLEKTLPDLTSQEPPNTPVSEDQSPPSLDMAWLKQLMVKLSHEQCAYEQEEGVQAADGIDLEHPISTTPEDFNLFKKWASTPTFKTVVEMYEPAKPCSP